MLIDAGKTFENPETGVYDAVFADYVDLGVVTSNFNGVVSSKKKVRLIWLLTAKDSEGVNFRIMSQVTQTMFEKGKLYPIVKSVSGAVPDPKAKFELETLIGKNNQLVVEKETAKTGKEYSNLKAILPPKVVFAVPAEFVRDKNKVKKDYSGNTSAAAASATASAAPAAVVQDEDIPF